MNKERLFELHQELNAEGMEIMRVKNNDYSGGVDDPFANFKDSTILGIEPELGIILRVLDKVKRIQTFIKKGELQVKGEPVKDAIIDIRNYFVLLAGMIEDRPERVEKAEKLQTSQVKYINQSEEKRYGRTKQNFLDDCQLGIFRLFNTDELEEMFGDWVNEIKA